MSSYVRRLEDKFLSEVLVVTAIFGASDDEQTTWALRTFPPEYVEPYLQAWRENRRKAWRHIKRLAAELKLIAGDNDAEWVARLQRLQIFMGSGVFIFAPTTQGTSQWG